ncbi:uncharacterized protein LOC110863319 [Folsomia candida]|uniref:uncharacterized protein LOC110863319 n=1 Tax=Folsomia candida TaxID=158441 RepID=UPI001604CFF0|nr:uncharacterized protein LOC110863319 [Folsomia candida]XP_035715440.1 uncharacterized protein LOC110863319 [Folsomia candida]
MDWPLRNYHSKGRPWLSTSLLLLALVLLEPVVAGESSPPVADVEDLFKDEGFLRMSRGGEAFGRRPPPPPLIHGPPHFSTQPPRVVFPTTGVVLPNGKGGNKGSVPPPRSNDPSSSRPGRLGGDDESKGGELFTSGSSNVGTGGKGQPPKQPLAKDVNAVFSKVRSDGGAGSDSDAHPLLGITPAAPGEAFDFNPILSNPAVTRILAGSSGRIPQWEPTLPDLHDLIPEVNYTVDPGTRSHTNSFNPSNKQPSSPSNPHPGGGSSSSSGNSNNPAVFVPSPASSNRSPTMYNMDQLTNNIAIPKHVLPNPSNLATSRSTVVVDDNGRQEDNFGGGGGGGGGGDDRDERYMNPNLNSPSNNGNNHLDHSSGDRGGESNPYSYDDEDSAGGVGGGGLGEDASSKGGFMGAEVQGKRGTWKGSDGLDGGDNSNRDGNGPKYIVCDALCGAWNHQCKLMGILFSITSVLCLIFSLVVLHSLHFSLRDFAPFSVILLFLFTASASRASILLAGWFCSPVSESRPTWLPILSVLPATFFVVAFLVALHLARFPFPFIKSYNTIPAYVILIISLGTVLLPLGLAVGAYFYPASHAPLTQGAWIAAHMMLVLVSLIYLFKFKPFYSKLSSERGSSGMMMGNGMNGLGGVVGGGCGSGMGMGGQNGMMQGGGGGGGGGSVGGNGNVMTNGSCNMSTLKNSNKRGFVVKWGCLQARAMFGAALLALTLSVMIIISVSMSRGECEKSSTWTGWVLSLCVRMLEFAIVILLLVVTIFSVDVRFISRLTRVSINKTNVGLINGDIYPTMVSSNTAVQRCIPMYSSNARADVMMLGPTESRSSLRGKTFGERTLPGERLGEYRSSVGRGLPLRLGNNGPSHSLPGTPVDGFPPGLKLPEPAPASLLVTKVVFGKPVSREVSHTHQHENPLLCTGSNHPGSKDDSNNIYASLESVKIAPFPNAGSSTGSNHSGSDRVLLSAPRDYIYSISRDLTKTIDSIYDASRPRGNNLAHTIESVCPPLDQIGSIPNLSGNQTGRGGHFNFHPHSMHHNHHHNGGGGNMSMTPGRTDLARTIERIRYAAAGVGPPPQCPLPNPNGPPHPGRNFVLQLANANNNSNNSNNNSHIPGMGNPPPYCSSESSHDVTPDSGIVSDIHSKSGRMDVSDNVYSREYKQRSSVEDVRRLPLLPLQKHRTPGHTPLYDRTPTSPASTPSSGMHPGIPHSTPNQQQQQQQQQQGNIVGRVEHLLNQTEHILSRTESLDSNSHSAGLQRLLSHKEQLEHVERLLAQAEYAIWLEKRTASSQPPSSHGKQDPMGSPYGYAASSNGGILLPPGFPSSANNSLIIAGQQQCNNDHHQQQQQHQQDVANNHNNISNSNSVTNGGGGGVKSGNHHGGNKKISKSLEEESVV